MRARYARILDGERLWLALDDVGSGPALATSTGELVHPPDDLAAGDQYVAPGVRAHRWYLPGVVGEPTRLRVVVPTPQGLRALASPRTPPAPGAVPTGDRRLHFELGTDRDGTMLVVARQGEPGVELLEVSGGEELDVLVRPPRAVSDATGVRLTLKDDNHIDPVAEVSCDVDGGAVRARLAGAEVSALAPATYRVELAVGDDVVPLCRRDNGLPDPRVVELPWLGDGSAQLVFDERGLLQLRRRGPGPEAGA